MNRKYCSLAANMKNTQTKQNKIKTFFPHLNRMCWCPEKIDINEYVHQNNCEQRARARLDKATGKQISNEHFFFDANGL